MHPFLRCPPFFPTLFILALMAGTLTPPAHGATDPALIDDFAAPALTARGAGRLLIDDQGLGSSSHATQRTTDGVLEVAGELKPGRGAPAFISVPLLLQPEGKPVDTSTYTGVRFRVKINQGNLTVQVATADIDNFDFHSAPVITKRGEFAEVRVPFAEMKRAWSPQTPLSTKLVTSVNLVAFAMAPGPFAYEVDEIAFY